jgi:hypothetical protein
MLRSSLPCPIPRCALEWYLTAQAAVAGTGIWLSGDARLGRYDICLPLLKIPMNSLRWGVALWFIAILQALALYLAPIAAQRWVAAVSAFCWAAFAISTYHAGMIEFACPVSALAALGQLYVCAMLRGARWTG